MDSKVIALIHSYISLQDQQARDSEYLAAEASGEDGKMLLKKLQRMWFVMEHKGSQGVNQIQRPEPVREGGITTPVEQLTLVACLVQVLPRRLRSWQQSFKLLPFPSP